VHGRVFAVPVRMIWLRCLRKSVADACHPVIAISVVPKLGTTQAVWMPGLDVAPVRSGRRAFCQDGGLRHEVTAPDSANAQVRGILVDARKLDYYLCLSPATHILYLKTVNCDIILHTNKLFKSFISRILFYYLVYRFQLRYSSPLFVW
jgi:hypothetical protein